MTQSYLKKFRSTLPTSQGNQILKILIKKRDQGEIKSVDDFKKKLQDLTKVILNERITPTLKLIKAVAGEETSSEIYNEMLNRIEDDLLSAFAEGNNIEEILESHEQLIERVALNALRLSINELETKVSLYEFLNRDSTGFVNAIFNTFNLTEDFALPSSSRLAGTLFVDPKTNELVSEGEIARPDPIGEKLILSSTDTEIPIVSATWLSNENSTRSELDVEFEQSSISNVIDGTSNTYWIVPILRSSVISPGVLLEMSLDLGSAKTINYVDIEPAVKFPMILESISYFVGSVETTLSISEISISRQIRINIPKIIADRVVLRFRQESCEETQFFIRPGESNISRSLLDLKSTIDIPSVATELTKTLSSDFILKDVLNLESSSLGEKVKYYEYIIGFDNIRVGRSVFSKKSIFVSKKKTVDKLGQVGIRVKETRPVQPDSSSVVTYQSVSLKPDTTLDDFYHGSIEYWILAQHFTANDTLIITDMLPILPVQATRIKHERLVLNEVEYGTTTKNVGILWHYTNADSNDIEVFRNKTKLTYGVDWEFVSDTSLSGSTITSPNSGSRMRRAIKIIGAFSPVDDLTVSYSPVVSNTTVVSSTGLNNYVDLSGDTGARLSKDNSIVFSNIRKSLEVAKTDIYLIVMLRRNSTMVDCSPALEEYMLMFSNYDNDKFTGV